MKVAFPIKEDKGLQSRLNEHFGMTGLFMVVDTLTRAFEVLPNQKAQEGSACKTGFINKETGVSAVVTHCIGDGSQRNLHGDGIQIFAAQGDTVEENLTRIEKGELKPFHMFDLCRGHKNKKEGGCGHEH